MTIRIVLDASTIAKWYLVEEESREARALRDRIVAGELEAHVPSLAFVELANVLRFAKGLSTTNVVSGVRAAMVIGMVVHGFEELAERAVEAAFEKDLTVYDSVYVALAELVKAALITYDDELLRKVEGARKASTLLEEINGRGR